MRQAAEKLAAMGPQAVLVKGGHLEGDAIDILFHRGEWTEFTSPRIETRHTHGTGCTFSAAITASLASGPRSSGSHPASQTLHHGGDSQQSGTWIGLRAAGSPRSILSRVLVGQRRVGASDGAGLGCSGRMNDVSPGPQQLQLLSNLQLLLGRAAFQLLDAIPPVIVLALQIGVFFFELADLVPLLAREPAGLAGRAIPPTRKRRSLQRQSE